MSTQLGKKVLFSDLSYRTTERNLIDYFSPYGEIEEFYLYKDDQDQSLRKGYLVYKDLQSVNNLMLKRPHVIDQRQIYLQREIPHSSRNRYSNLSEQLGMNLSVNEIFISRLCSGETREMFVKYFQSFGNIIDCRVLNSFSQNPRQTGYAFIRFMDYDTVDQIILSRPHVINSKFYHIRKCIPREYNFIISSIKPISQNRPNWRHYSFGLINMKTQQITYPTKSSPHYTKQQSSINDFQVIDRPALTVSVDRTPTKPTSNQEFEIIPTHSPSSSSISLINSLDDFTPLASPLYSTAIAYSPTTMNNDEKNIYELI